MIFFIKSSILFHIVITYSKQIQITVWRDIIFHHHKYITLIKQIFKINKLKSIKINHSPQR